MYFEASEAKFQEIHEKNFLISCSIHPIISKNRLSKQSCHD